VPYWNLGCASQRNLAALVDNKADLVQPRGEIPPYTGRRTTVLDKYHRGESTATVYPDNEKAKLSELGK
jgi:pilus assembly protein CpaD